MTFNQRSGGKPPSPAPSGGKKISSKGGYSDKRATEIYRPELGRKKPEART